MTETNTRLASYNIRTGVMLLAGIGGVLALVIGFLLLSSASDRRARHAFISRLPDLLSGPHDETGILEGRIAGSVPPIRAEFVAYLREQYQNRDGNAWVSLSGELQPLTVETSTGSVRVINADYALDRAIHEWTPSRREESPPTATSGSIRIEGLVAGGTVMIVGRTTAGGASGQIIAESIGGVDRKTYLDRLLQGDARVRSFAIALLLIGLAGIAYAVWEAPRIWRDPRGKIAQGQDCVS